MPDRDELDSLIASYELAARMQVTAPELFDLSTESEATQRLYGIDQKQTEAYGRRCLLARRLCEAGVRYIQVNYGDDSANPAWDQHSNLPKHADHAAAVDQPIAGLLTDLAQRGLLEDTLVWWGGEFGRAPYAEKNGTGRDHNPQGFTMWLSGGGVRPGIAYGETDEFGQNAIVNKVHMHDMHATIFHLLGIDHERLTYRYAGRDFRLTDVHGRVVSQLFSQ
jgi:arylsulfatase A-like enzyme